MSNYFVISKKIIHVFLAVLLLMFVAVSLSWAQDSSDSVAKKYGLTFPVIELGNCTSLDGCKSYCSDPANQTACIDFAKKHGFYKEQEAKTKQAEILNAAGAELGCSTESECKAFCGEQQNWIKCGEFAKKHNLGPKPTPGPDQDVKKQALLEKAKQFLGCSSYEECKAFCGKEDNHQKCAEFARQSGLDKGPASSKAYENANKNASFCRQYPEKCQTIPPNRENCQNLKEEMGSASAEQIKAYYLKNCAPPSYQQSSPIPSPMTKEQYCRIYPERCNFSPSPFTTSGNTGTSSSVKGISAVRNFVQTLMDWFR